MEAIDFYKEFNVYFSASNDEIIDGYQKRINILSNINNLSNEQINTIKTLKAGLYILLNPELRIKYNKVLNLKHKQSNDSFLDINNYDKDLNLSKQNMIPIDTEPLAMNQQSNDNLDTLFNVDNSWMNNIKSNDDFSRKNKEELNQISNRIFSMSEYNMPQFSSDFEQTLRKQKQGRIDKNKN